jgi:WD40 repeat protein
MASHTGREPDDSVLLARFLTGRDPAAGADCLDREGRRGVRRGEHAGAAPASTVVMTLARSGLLHVALPRIKLGLLLLLAVGTVAAGSVLSVYQRPAAEPGPAAQDAPPPAASSNKQQARTDRYGDPLPPGALARLGTLRFRHSQNVADIAYSPDGKILAAVGSDMVCLWDAATGNLLRRLDGATIGHGLAFAPDGKSLATVIYRTVAFWDPATGEQIRGITIMRPVQSLTFSPDGKTLAWLTRDNTLHLNEAVTGQGLHQWPGPPNYMPSSVAFSPDSRTLALPCQKDNEIALYDTVTGKEVRRLVGHQASVYGVAFSPDRKTLASAARDATLRFWDAATGKELRRVQDDRAAWNLAFSPDGSVLATGGTSVCLWEPATGKLLRQCEGDDDGNVECLAFSPDGKTVAASRGDSHALSFWDVASGKKRLDFAGHLGTILEIAVSPDGTLLASAAWEKNHTCRNAIRLWNPATGKEVGTLGTDLGYVGGLAFSPDGRLLAAGNEDGTIRIWDPATRREVRRLTGHKKMVEWVGFTAGGRVLVSLGWHDRTIRLWDVAAGKELHQFRGNQAFPAGGGLALARDGKTIVQGGEARPSLVLWDAATGKVMHRFGDHRERVTALALSPDGRTLASAGNYDGVRLWDVASGKEVRWLADPNAWVDFLVFSADGRTLASGGVDGVIRLWEVATGTERSRFAGHRGAVGCGAFSPDGRTFFSGSPDTTVLIWDVTGRAAESRPQTVELSPRKLEELRADLAAADGSRAHRALWALAAAPGQAVPLFREQLRPVVAADPERVARLVADLDSNDFTVREKATKELHKMREAALPALRKALAGQPAPELRLRAERLLDDLSADSAAQVYQSRAIEVLERIGSPDARRVLETLAGGVPEARLTQEAKASLGRLARRHSFNP